MLSYMEHSCQYRLQNFATFIPFMVKATLKLASLFATFRIDCYKAYDKILSFLKALRASLALSRCRLS